MMPLFIILLVWMGCHNRSKDDTVVQGRFSETAHSRLFLFQLLPDSIPLVDSAVTDEEGNFSFSLSPVETSFYMLRNEQGDFITLAAGKGETIQIDGSGKDRLRTYSVSGSPESQVLREYHLIVTQNQQKIDSLSGILKKSQPLREFPAIRKELDSVYRDIYESNREQVISLLFDNITSLASIIISNGALGGTPILTMDNDFQLFSAIDSALGKAYMNNRNYLAFHKNISRYRSGEETRRENIGSLSPGMKVPEINLPDANDKNRKLSLLQGKITLVCFWSSWNSESREMNVGLARLYEQFHTRGFEIVGISLDTERDSWLNAVRQDRSTWMQLNDSKGLKSEVALEFSIKKLPATLLLDREGIVISEGLSIPEIKALLLEKL